jgi:VWFA-related protein
VMVGLFVLDMRLNLVQQYTNKKEVILAAAKKALSSSREDLRLGSEAIQQGLAGIANGMAAPEGKPELGGSGDRQLDARMAQLTTKILSHQDTQSSQGGWRTMVASMRAIGQEQEVVSGRKTLLFFSWGIWIPTEQVDTLQNLQSTLTRAHVSVYPVYVAGLSMWSQAQDTRAALTKITDDSVSSTANPGGRTIENAESTMRSNGLQTMNDFAKGTSGVVMGESNDFKGPMQQLAGDINNYYEVSYIPTNGKLDGTFRKVNIKVSRAKTVLARNGYLALPAGTAASSAAVALPYEAPLLAALNQPAPAHAFDYRTKIPYFESRNGKQRRMVIMEIPFANLTIAEDAKAKKCRSQLALMAVFKDADGKVAEKVSDYYPFEWPLDRLEAIKKGSFTWNKQVQLPQGKYTVETVVYDRASEKISIVKTPIEVSAGETGLQLSSLSVIKKADQANANDAEAGSPFRLGSQKLSPFVDEPVMLKVGDPLILYFVAYPSPQSTDKPQLKLQVIQGGISLGEIPAELPAADAQGRIQYTGTLPTNAFPPGNYEFKAKVTQGNTTAETKTAVNLIQ